MSDVEDGPEVGEPVAAEVRQSLPRRAGVGPRQVHLLGDDGDDLRRGEARATPAGPTGHRLADPAVRVDEEGADDVDRRRARVDPAAEVREPGAVVLAEPADADDVVEGRREVLARRRLVA